jgi:hypothetical protein
MQQGEDGVHSMTRWFSAKRMWVSSVFSDLPRLGRSSDAGVDAWLVICGGLALVLSRVDDGELERRLGRSRELFDRVRGQLKKGRAVHIDAGLLTDVMQELSPVADPMTLSCLRVCLMSARHGELGEQRRRRDSEDARAASQLSTWPRSSALRPRVDETQFGEELFQERFSGLRKTVAAARATGFGDLK